MTICAKKIRLWTFALSGVLSFSVHAQKDKTPIGESGEPIADAGIYKPARDDAFDHNAVKDRLVLPYDHIRESDVMWEKRVWRVVDLREKMNLHFAYPTKPFFEIIKNAASEGKLVMYSDESFQKPIVLKDCQGLWSTKDTVSVYNFETDKDEVTIVDNAINIADIKRFRIKEVWFFDKETSRMQVRILGIAPLISKTDENGNFLFEYPLGWIYYPNIRGILANENAYLGNNVVNNNSWEDIFEMRWFSSLITKASNVQDKRIEDTYSGVNALLESEKIHNEIFNYEQDLWQY